MMIIVFFFLLLSYRFLQHYDESRWQIGKTWECRNGRSWKAHTQVLSAEELLTISCFTNVRLKDRLQKLQYSNMSMIVAIFPVVNSRTACATCGYTKTVSLHGAMGVSAWSAFRSFHMPDKFSSTVKLMVHFLLNAALSGVQRWK